MHDRIKGAEEVLKASGMIIAAKQPAYSESREGYTVTQNVLQANPDINGVFSANDEMALGALRAMQQAGKRVPIIGVDATEDALKSILAGEMYGSVAQGNYDMGLLAIEKAIELKAGKTIEKRIDSGATLITKENAQDLLDFRMSIKRLVAISLYTDRSNTCRRMYLLAGVPNRFRDIGNLHDILYGGNSVEYPADWYCWIGASLANDMSEKSL